jgi:hypothetical protein
MPDDVAQVLDELLPAERRSGDLTADLCEAGREAMRRRVANTHNGGVVIGALRERGLSWRAIEEGTGIPQATARRWHEPPPRVGGDQ